MSYHLRQFREADASALAEITLAAIERIGATAYSPAQVSAWAARHPRAERFVERSANGADIFVAADADDNAVAYSVLEAAEANSGHLDMLYCHPNHTRIGLAERLLEAAEECARGQNMTRLFTEASELARPVFERCGYKLLHRRDLEIEGTPIHNFAMEKHLLRGA